MPLVMMSLAVQCRNICAICHSAHADESVVLADWNRAETATHSRAPPEAAIAEPRAQMSNRVIQKKGVRE
jgi:hypothetical protein